MVHGTIPDDVKIKRYDELNNGITIMYLDRPLTAKELDFYDIPSETISMPDVDKFIDYKCMKGGNKLQEDNEYNDYDFSIVLNTSNPNSDEFEKLTHHMEYLVDLDSAEYPISFYNVKVEANKDSVIIRGGVEIGMFEDNLTDDDIADYITDLIIEEGWEDLDVTLASVSVAKYVGESRDHKLIKGGNEMKSKRLKTESTNEEIDAVKWMFGLNNKEAKEYIKTNSKEMVAEIVKGYLNNAKKNFYDESVEVKTENKKIKTEAYNYNWRDDIDEVENIEENDELVYAFAENLIETDPDYANYDDPWELISDIISIWKIEKRSRLYDYLLKWYGSEENMKKHIRSFYETNNAIYFETGCGYSIFDADLLGGNADGETARAFDTFVANGGKKEESKEIKTERKDTLKLSDSDIAYLKKIGHTDEDIPQIEEALNTTKYTLGNAGVSDNDNIKIPDEEDDVEISAQEAREILGDETFLSGLSRSAFHWTSGRWSADNTKYVSFDSSKLFKESKKVESLRADTKEAIELAVNEIDNGNSDDPKWFNKTYVDYDGLVKGVYDLFVKEVSSGFGRDIKDEPKITSASNFSGKEEIIAEIKRKLADYGYTKDYFITKKTEAPDEPKEETEANEDEEENNDSVTEAIDDLKNKSSFYEWAVEDIVEDAEDYNGETLKDKILSRCSEILEHGCVSGTVSSLIYYSDTVAIFDKYADDLYDLIEDYDPDTFLDMLKQHVNTTEIVLNCDTSKNWIVWLAYEEVAYQLQNSLENEQE